MVGFVIAAPRASRLAERFVNLGDALLRGGGDEERAREVRDAGRGEPVDGEVKTTALRQFPGWTVREYRDGLFDAAGSRGLTRGVDSFHAAVDEVRAMETGERAR